MRGEVSQRVQSLAIGKLIEKRSTENIKQKYGGMTVINELKEKRFAIVKQARAKLEDAQKESRSLTQEEQNAFDKAMAEVDAIGNQISNIERLAGVEGSESRSVESRIMVTQEAPKHFTESKEYRSAFDKLVRHGKQVLNSDEIRSLAAGTGDGANTVSNEYEAAVTEKLTAVNFMRQVCTVITTGSDRNIPVEDDVATALWIDEAGTITDDDDPGFTKKTLKAYKLAHIVKYSYELAQDAQFDMPGYIGRKLGMAFGTAEEAGFMTGAGTTKPTGVVPGAGTGKTTASASAITADELLDFHYSLGQAYRKGAVYAMNDSTVKVIRKLKDGEGRYIWVPGLGDEVDSILGRPLYTSSAMAEVAASAKVAVVFNPECYTIADRLGTQFKILDQLYAASGLNAVLAIKRVDGMLTLAEAAKVLVMHA